MTIKRNFVLAATAACMLLGSASAFAGPFILAGTDADDHGLVNTTTGLNDDGWLFMQRALENIAPSVTNGQKTVVSLGTDPSTQAGNAALSAFGKSNLVGAGWTYFNLNTVGAITAFFSGTSARNSSNTGIIMLDSSATNVGGGLNSTEEAELTANALKINAFLGAGGGLFSQANSYGWLSAILPGATTGSESNQGISLTPAGSAAFPGLTNADLSSGPYHANFTGIGAINILGTGTTTSSAIIIGANAGSITAPVSAVPEPTTIALLGLGLLGFAASRRKAAKK